MFFVCVTVEANLFFHHLVRGKLLLICLFWAKFHALNDEVHVFNGADMSTLCFFIQAKHGKKNQNHVFNENVKKSVNYDIWHIDNLRAQWRIMLVLFKI